MCNYIPKGPEDDGANWFFRKIRVCEENRI